MPTPYGTAPAYGYNPYATPANPYAPNPTAFSQPMNYTQPNVQPNVTSAMPVQQPVMNTQPVQNTNGPFIVVNGVQGAKDVQVPANQTAWMMDQNAPQFYVKSADNLGICKMDYYRFEKFDPEQEAQMAMQAQMVSQQQVVTQPIGITREEVEEIVTEKLEAYKSFLMPTQKPATTSKAKKDTNDG